MSKRKLLAEKYKSEGVCASHPDRPLVSETCCQECLDRKTAGYNQKMSDGLCYRCGNPRRSDRATCEDCAIASAIYAIKRGQVLRDQGFCPSHPDQPLVLDRSCCQKCVWRNAEGWMIRTYGITTEDYAWMEYHQNRKCAMQDCPTTSLDETLAIDHCHETNEVRGLLCADCNKLVGAHEKALKMGVIEYLARSK